MINIDLFFLGLGKTEVALGTSKTDIGINGLCQNGKKKSIKILP